MPLNYTTRDMVMVIVPTTPLYYTTRGIAWLRVVMVATMYLYYTTRDIA